MAKSKFYIIKMLLALVLAISSTAVAGGAPFIVKEFKPDRTNSVEGSNITLTATSDSKWTEATFYWGPVTDPICKFTLSQDGQCQSLWSGGVGETDQCQIADCNDTLVSFAVKVSQGPEGTWPLKLVMKNEAGEEDSKEIPPFNVQPKEPRDKIDTTTALSAGVTMSNGRSMPFIVLLSVLLKVTLSRTIRN